MMLDACQRHGDEPITSSIVGVWTGSKAVFNINPSGIIPAFNVTEDNFPIQLEFKSDGTLVLTKNSQTTAGTYSLSGRDLVININYTFEYLDMAGTYHVESLTQTNLSASIEKDGTFKHPDTGQQFNGKVKATLYLNRKS